MGGLHPNSELGIKFCPCCPSSFLLRCTPGGSRHRLLSAVPCETRGCGPSCWLQPAQASTPVGIWRSEPAHGLSQLTTPSTTYCCSAFPKRETNNEYKIALTSIFYLSEIESESAESLTIILCISHLRTEEQWISMPDPACQILRKEPSERL